MKPQEFVRINISFTKRHNKLLEAERKRTGVPTAVLLRQLIDKHFAAQKRQKASDAVESTWDEIQRMDPLQYLEIKKKKEKKSDAEQ